MLQRNWGNTKPRLGSRINWAHSLARNLMGCWLMNEGGGLIANDIALKNHGTLTNGPTWGAGRFGSAINFDGSDDCVSSFGSSVSPVGSRTICAWVYPITTGRTGILGTRPSTGNQGITFTANRTTAGNLSYFHTGGTLLEVAAGMVINQWQHVCVTLDTLTAIATLYRNGLFISNKDSFSVETASTFKGSIADEGAGLSSIPFKGLIDNVHVYNRALTDAEIQQLYCDPFCFIERPRLRWIPKVGTFDRGPMRGIMRGVMREAA